MSLEASVQPRGEEEGRMASWAASAEEVAAVVAEATSSRDSVNVSVSNCRCCWMECAWVETDHRWT